ncbi:hypothetical protein EAE96_007090 [Botrytis aclada]|nr:hypothetical protein EAE96_007090 [Botrytis aclada]
MPSRIEENKYEIMDLLVRMNSAVNEVKENSVQIEQILASGVITQEEDYTVRTCRRSIEFSNGLLACYEYYLSWCLCAERIGDEERLEAERKADSLHQAAWACLQGMIPYFLFNLTPHQISTRNDFSKTSLTLFFNRTHLKSERRQSIRGVFSGKRYTENGTQHTLSLQLFGSGMTDLIPEELRVYSDP